ncbi:MAG: hypothetical protein IPM39_09485 [Chloroflexi bacterium]|nr:hypothetical protein [Chloroflexota bacterium]
MPQFQVGDMWTAYETAGLFLVTTNSTLTADGRLVLGWIIIQLGMARQARERFPGLDAALGAQIQTICGSQGFYGLLISQRWPAAKLAAFQVKYHWQRPADLSLVTQSVTALTWWARYHADCAIHLNFPGIGNGGLARTAVLPLLKSLPDNVSIWEYAHDTAL